MVFEQHRIVFSVVITLNLTGQSEDAFSCIFFTASVVSQQSRFGRESELETVGTVLASGDLRHRDANFVCAFPRDRGEAGGVLAHVGRLVAALLVSEQFRRCQYTRILLDQKFCLVGLFLGDFVYGGCDLVCGCYCAV